VSFGQISSWEEAKPFIWGTLLPLIFSLIWGDILPLIIVPAFAALIQLLKGEEKKSGKTLGFSLIIPAVFIIYLLVSIILAVI